jgi:aspartyl-tRNA synthetase
MHKEDKNLKELSKEEISLNGWIEKIRNLGKIVFFELKSNGTSKQIVVKEKEEIKKINSLKSGDLINVIGILKLKEDNNSDAEKMEVLLKSSKLVNKTITLPFEIKDLNLKEDNRYHYRYLDLRRDESRKVIIAKHELLNFIRNFFYNEKFIEIETPILSQSSPEGAKTFTVQSNIKDRFYTLPQSPQIFKQILMISGFEKYYQIAKSFRKEGARSNRQLEFLQLDIEISFPKKNYIINLIEKMMREILINIFEKKEEDISFEKMTFNECFEKYGSDKPDLRNSITISNFQFKLMINSEDEIQRISEKGIFIKRELKNTEVEEVISQIRNENDELEYIIFNKFNNSLNIIYQKGKNEVNNNFKSNIGDGSYIIIKGKNQKVNELLGKTRNILGKNEIKENEKKYIFLWITDWPLFEYSEEKNKIIALRHPFTMPKEEYLDKLDENEFDPLSIITDSYDLVCNGEEFASGSLRIHKRDLQQKVFKILGFSENELEKHFGYFLKALEFAAPPHGGIGIGIERMLLVFLNLKNLKETVAFPKNIDGSCSLTGAPNSI